MYRFGCHISEEGSKEFRCQSKMCLLGNKMGFKLFLSICIVISLHFYLEIGIEYNGFPNTLTDSIYKILS